jgi:hypothetical protein
MVAAEGMHGGRVDNRREGVFKQLRVASIAGTLSAAAPTKTLNYLMDGWLSRDRLEVDRSNNRSRLLFRIFS